MNTCMYPGCTWSMKTRGVSRGLCRNHYNNASSLVRRGKTSWATLVANGKVKAPKMQASDAWFLEPKNLEPKNWFLEPEKSS